MDLGEAFRARKTCREFSSAPVSSADKAALLSLGRARPEGGWAYPSAHDLRAVSLDDVGPAIPRDAIESAVFDAQPWLLRAPELMVISADLNRVHDEFDDQDASGAQARDFAMIEAGCLLQSVLLACADRGLAAVPVAGLRRPDIDTVLGLPDHVVSLIAIGHPAD